MTLLPSRPTAEKCGLCKSDKETFSYNAAREGVTLRTVELCRRCDLTAEQPKRPDARATL